MNVEPTASPPAVTGAIRQAARVTGADFKYLLATAQVESNFNPNARAPASTARGLFQFVEQTWLTTLKEQGGALGYGPYADAISRQASGQYSVSDPRMYNRIMDLRSDPNANALMAGAYTRANAGRLAERLGRQPSEGELYIAHFMGPNGAARLIDMAQSRMQSPAAAAFPGPARANPSVFYDARGNARAAGEVYRSLVGRYGTARAGPANKAAPEPANRISNEPANAGATAGQKRLAGGIKPQGGDRDRPTPMLKPMPEPAPLASQIEPSSAAANPGLVFHGLFRSAGASEPVAPVVSALWSAAASNLPASAAVRSAPLKPQLLPEVPVAAPAGAPLDLFQQQLPDARALFRGRV